MNEFLSPPRTIKFMMEMELEVPTTKTDSQVVMGALQHFLKVHSLLPLGDNEVQLVPGGQVAYMIQESE